MEVRREVQRNLDLMDGQCGKGGEGQRGREINGCPPSTYGRFSVRFHMTIADTFDNIITLNFFSLW